MLSFLYRTLSHDCPLLPCNSVLIQIINGGGFTCECDSAIRQWLGPLQAWASPVIVPTLRVVTGVINFVYSVLWDFLTILKNEGSGITQTF